MLLVLLGLVTLASRFDSAADGTTISSARSTGLSIQVPDGPTGTALRSGDLVTRIGGEALTDRIGGLPLTTVGYELTYEISRDGPQTVSVRLERPDGRALLLDGWGNLVFVAALAGLALALHLRRPDEPATAPLLVAAAGLFGSTLAFVAGLPAVAVATGGPLFWLYQVNVVGSYAAVWGAVLAFALLVVPAHPWLRRGRVVLVAAALGPLVLMIIWTAVAAIISPNAVGWLGLVLTGQTVVVTLSLATGVAVGIAAYRATQDPLVRSRLRWLAGGGSVAALLTTVAGPLTTLVLGHPVLPSGAIGLAGLPFVVGLAVALRRHQLFDIERLANRSLVYLAVLAVLAVGYAGLVAVLISAVQLSGVLAAGIAAAVVAIVLAPLRSAAQRTVNRLMYGDRDDPTKVLGRLGDRLQAVMAPDEVFSAVVETVAQSLRLPFVALDVSDGAGRFRTVAERGTVAGVVHAEPLVHHGVTVGRLRVSERGRDDALDPADRQLIRSLSRQIAPAVEAVRLQEDLRRSRAEVVALREDERRRIRRDLHDGLGPTLAAIGLKAGLAARQVEPASAAGRLLGEIDGEVRSSLADVRRLVEALRPPALDELGLVGAVRSRAAALAGTLEIEVTGEVGALPAAIETAAYRIAVEAVTNAVRHSGASGCWVVITTVGERLELAVRDDGRGLPAGFIPGVGLRSMRERAAEVGGAVTAQTGPDGGTLVSARLPLPLPPGGSR